MLRVSPFRLIKVRRVATPTALLALTGLTAILLVAALAPALAPYHPALQDPEATLVGMSSSHLLGTDNLGRDLFSRVLVGTRYTLFGSALAVAVSAVIGIPLGLAAGYFGGWFEMAVMAVIEVLQSFPGFLLAIIFVAIAGPSLVNAAIAVGIAGIAHFVRVTRGCVLGVRDQDYVHSAVGKSISRTRIIGQYVLPNIAAPILVLTVLSLGSAVLTVAGLSFLGLGAQPPTPEWGVLMREGRDYMTTNPGLIVWPGLAIILLVVSLNVVGDWLEQFVNVRRRRV